MKKERFSYPLDKLVAVLAALVDYTLWEFTSCYFYFFITCSMDDNSLQRSSRIVASQFFQVRWVIAVTRLF